MLDQETIDATLAEWYTTELLREQVPDSGVSFFGAQAGDSVTGYASAGMNELGHGEIGAIYVDPDYWRSGTGTRLIERFEDHGQEQGWEPMQIRVIGRNDVARPFYEAHGYDVESSLNAPLFGESIEEVCYQKQLG